MGTIRGDTFLVIKSYLEIISSLRALYVQKNLKEDRKGGKSSLAYIRQYQKPLFQYWK